MNKCVIFLKYVPKLSGELNLYKLGTYNCVRNLVRVIQDKKKGTAQLVLQKPPVNGFNLEMFQKLTTTIKELEEKKARGIIITSNLPKVFCAGFDIMEFYKPSEENLRVLWKTCQTFWKTLYLTPLVTIAAVNGHAPGFGCVILMCCDHSIMVNSNFRLGLIETLLGFASPKWAQLLLVNACKARAAEHALKKSKLFTPKEALDFGIVDELVDSSSDLLPKAEQALDQFLKVPASTFQREKLNARKSFVDDIVPCEDQEIDDIVKVLFADETQSIIEKYLESLKGRNDQKLAALPKDIFSDLPNLGLFNVEKNFFTTISEEVFTKSAISYALIDNPIICNCDVKWITTSGKLSRKFFLGTCAEPESFKGKELNTLTEEDFRYCR